MAGEELITTTDTRLLNAASDLLDAVDRAIPSFVTYGEASYDTLLKLCRAYKKATGKRHPADRWTEHTKDEK